ncbi:MAG: antibiotic biosynthesis monooxygenase [Bacteroidota bacterium]|nr:antibiotic biosynthesis monooxygenase [Bacteroidota bacterium]MDX5429638.1 antibiotic biosynthesis monooxygenase [Bacteroidota bacterium]MDX5468419.1 antibiotic biosynthesis monooxygenase [Bacteroidota bacterium]
MITRIVKMSFREEAIPEFLAIFEASKDKIRAFPGNCHVEMLQAIHEPNICFTYSLWESEEALNAYRHSELFESTWAATKVLFNDKPEAWSTENRGVGQTA